ncbi:hypothetical protein OHA77_16080 [Streptosporangium sp. NBC_01639]|uniref:hypothetical protein n=1 Tax=Streptosporangium sp. NBC_01639 TaxID=2975948 RepID=UPI003864E057|nr:hypothetical protein OHA77_16080 [Streptosporangium sp. NBC_01639]
MTTTERTSPAFRFPGRLAEGAGLVLGPVLILAGVLLRVEFGDFFPEQLAAFAGSPVLMTVSYSAFVAGVVLLWPAVAAVTRRIGALHSGWAMWGGGLVTAGLFARVFHAGVNHLAFQLVDVQGLEVAQRAVSDQYGAFHVFQPLDIAVFSGWIVLALGAWRADVFGAGVTGTARCVALGLMSAMPLGVLKGTGPMSVLAAAGLCVALVPLGVRVLRDGSAPRWWAYPLAVVVGAGAVLLGTLG